MKKINYLVLMAAMMLIGTNAWAETITLGNKTVDPSATYDHLGDAFKNAKDGDVIKLVTNLEDANQSWFGEKSATGSSRSITLDLNGKTFTYTGSKGVAIPVTRGKLEITSTSGVGTMTTAVKTDLIRVYGTYQKIDAKNSTPFTHLVVNENVQLVCTNNGANAVTVDVMRQGEKGVFQDGTYPLDYACNFYEKISGGGHGVANGVRLDIYGTLISKKYAIKVNGCIRLGKEFLDESGNPKTTSKGANPYYDSIPKTNPVVYFEPKRSGGSYTITDKDGDYSPYVFISSSARLVTNNYESTSSIAAYSSGYGRWQIEGYCEGSTGVYVKSGEVILNNATVTSNYQGDYVPAGREGTDRASGVDAAGSGVVMESSSHYSGAIDVTVQGDTKVEGTTGYAIDEAITAPDEQTKVDALTITGGTFGSGEEGQGAIKVTETTAAAAEDEEQPTTITITGGAVQGADDDAMIGSSTLSEYLSDQESTTHVTIIENEDHSTTVVVTQGTNPTDYTTVKGHADDAVVNWKKSGSGSSPQTETLDADVTLKELVINQTGYNQTLTVSNGVTLSVGRVILGAKAQIIVEAGGSFIVTGEQGITAKSSDNIILKTSSTSQALFLVNPAVNANKHPKAKVELYSQGYHDSELGKDIYQRFGVPSYDTTLTLIDIERGAPSAYQKLTTDGWVEVMFDDWDDEYLVPFTTYAVTCNASAPGTIYKFSCNLVGNTDAVLRVNSKWNYYANSYTAPISIAEMVNELDANYKNVSGTVYLHDATTNLWHEVNNSTIYTHPEYGTQIKPMYAFILQSRSAGANPVVDYKDQVYDPALAALAPAPARASVAPFATAVVEIVAADGTKDEVSLLEGEQFSAEFDNTYDATKLMNGNQTYLYANGMDEKLGIIATDNLEGTTLSIAAKEQTSFIMTIRNANGMNYAIRDMLTGTEVELTEGATYMFTVPANTNVDGRFQVVGVHKVPTAIDNVEEVAATKGIYNMAGQYMGNDYHSLSAGVYVVDGKKVVK